MIISSNINWRPTSWLQTRANFGTDFADRVDNNLHMNGEGWPLTSTYRDGEAFNARTNITNITADLGATANYNPSRLRWLSLKTTVGTQYTNYRSDENEADGTTLPPGALTASAGSQPFDGTGGGAGFFGFGLGGGTGGSSRDRLNRTDQENPREGNNRQNAPTESEQEQIEARQPVIKADDWVIIEIDYHLPPRPIPQNLQQAYLAGGVSPATLAALQQQNAQATAQNQAQAAAALAAAGGAQGGSPYTVAGVL